MSDKLAESDAVDGIVACPKCDNDGKDTKDGLYAWALSGGFTIGKDGVAVSECQMTCRICGYERP